MQDNMYISISNSSPALMVWGGLQQIILQIVFIYVHTQLKPLLIKITFECMVIYFEIKV